MLYADPDSPVPKAASSARRLPLRREVFIASLVLGGLAALIALFVSLSSSEDSTEPRTQISAAGWLTPATADAGERPYAPADNRSASAPDSTQEPAAKYAPPDQPETSSTVTAGGLVKSGTVQSNTPVIKSLTNLGLSMGQAHALITALDGIYDFRRSRPGQMFEVRLDPKTEKPTYFRYEVSLTEVYEVVQQNNSFKGRRKQIRTQKKARRYGGTIASSLYKALVELHAHPSLAGRIVDVLSNQVDFYKEQRPGDTFRVLVEEESLKGEFLGYGPVLALEYNGTKSGRKRFFRFETATTDAVYYNEKAISQPKTAISIPLHYTRISSPFGRRYHPVLKRRLLHNGVDFAAPHGTPVWACQEGTVVTADRRGANGNLVIINHDENLVSYYAHLQRFARGIKRNVKVRERQVIGYVGSTGRSTGAHLHFGLKKGAKFIDPLKYRIQPGRPAPRKYRNQVKTMIAKNAATLDKIPIRSATAPLEKAPDDKTEVLGLEDLE